MPPHTTSQQAMSSNAARREDRLVLSRSRTRGVTRNRVLTHCAHDARHLGLTGSALLRRPEVDVCSRANGSEHFIHQFTQSRIASAFVAALRRVLRHIENVPAYAIFRYCPFPADSLAAHRTAIMKSHSDAHISGHDSTRRAFLTTLLKGSALVVAAPLMAMKFPEAAPAALPPVTVFKDPSCGCCKLWVKHMEKAGFNVTVRDTPDMDGMKQSVGLPVALASCHTAVIGNYLIEGHVPADLVQKFLAEKSAARGLTVPGMVVGSPGMEGATREKYDVLLFEKNGKSRVYASR
jgi:hypothetical protein